MTNEQIKTLFTDLLKRMETLEIHMHQHDERRHFASYRVPDAAKVAHRPILSNRFESLSNIPEFEKK